MSTSGAKSSSLSYPSAQKMQSYTLEQFNTLLDFFETNRELARGRDRLYASEKWKDIKNKLNSISPGSQKSTKQWQKIWTDKKYLARKAKANSDQPLSKLDFRILNILGELELDTGPLKTPVEAPVVENAQNSHHSTQLPQERLQNEILFNVDVGIKREADEEGEVVSECVQQLPERQGIRVVEEKVLIKKEKLRDEENQLSDPLHLGPQYLKVEIRGQDTQYLRPPPCNPVYTWNILPAASSSAAPPSPESPPTETLSRPCIARVPGPTPKQLQVLLKFFEENRDVALGSLNSSIEERCKLRNKWTEVIKKLNRMGGCKKTRKQWQKYWADRKYIARKEYQRLKSDPERLQRLLANDKDSTNERFHARIMAILGLTGEETKKGRNNVAVVKGVQNKSSQLLHLLTDQSSGKVAEERLVQENSNGEGIHNAQNDMQCEEGDRNITSDRLNVENRLSAPSALDLDHDYEQMRLNAAPSNRLKRRANEPPNEGPQVEDAGIQRMRRSPTRAFSQRLFRIEERREENDRRRNQELAGIRTAVVDLCKLMRQLVECHYEK